MTRPSHDALLDEITRLGLSGGRATKVLDDAIRLIRAHLSPAGVERVAGALPSPLDHRLREAKERPITLGHDRASEELETALRALGGVLPEDVIAFLEEALPAAIACHLRRAVPPPPAYAPGTTRNVPPVPIHTLATGRPGSEHPLSESAPDHERRARHETQR